MAGLTCDYCGQGDNGKGMVQVYQGGIYQMHADCWKKFRREQEENS